MVEEAVYRKRDWKIKSEGTQKREQPYSCDVVHAWLARYIDPDRLVVPRKKRGSYILGKKTFLDEPIKIGPSKSDFFSKFNKRERHWEFIIGWWRHVHLSNKTNRLQHDTCSSKHDIDVNDEQYHSDWFSVFFLFSSTKKKPNPDAFCWEEF